MQWILFVMLVSATGDMKYQDPTVFYSKYACETAQHVIADMAPKNASTTVVTACVKRGTDKE